LVFLFLMRLVCLFFNRRPGCLPGGPTTRHINL
jgi:hypothetical protein